MLKVILEEIKYLLSNLSASLLVLTWKWSPDLVKLFLMLKGRNFMCFGPGKVSNLGDLNIA